MSLSDLWFLLRLELRQSFRVTGRTGLRTEQKSWIRRMLPVIGAILVGALIYTVVVSIVPIFWADLVLFLRADLGIAATIFNAILLFGFAGSIMFSATTVGNSARMEYLLVMPMRMRIIFLEKTIVIILYNCVLWMVIGFPILLGLGTISTYPLALLAAPIFLVLVFMLVTMGVSIGGLVGLLFSRLLAGRRTLKQIGYFILSTLAIVVSVFWYYSFYFSDNGTVFFDAIFRIADMVGLSSHLSPGYTVSAISIGLVVGAPFGIPDIVAAILFLIIGISLVYANSYVCEIAHYSGWLASGSQRTSKSEFRINHTSWNPRTYLPFTFNTTTSTSIWYNIASIRREGRVIAQYLVGPIRWVIWIVLPGLYMADQMAAFTPYLFVAALIPFATSYGLSFAGYELVYEGKNLMNLQLASANLVDYVKGKVLSATPFVLGASSVVSIMILILYTSMWPLLPAVILGCVFANLVAGSVAANAAAMGGDFRAERKITRQRGAAVQMPIRGWSMLRATLMPNIVAYVGVFSILGVGALNPLYAYVALSAFALICYRLFLSYSRSAGRRLSQIEASEYL
ncbi:MAG: hypothetical protein JSW61_09915 [Candidatus Thorarchaeota archaeon]|nr:MAG: hypothetical protein JSW61_09915 [Candidatus Thorarchaeota archaeon]